MQYTMAVFVVIGISAIIMYLIFNRLKLMSFRMLVSITLASFASAIALPGIFNIMIANKSTDIEHKKLLLIIVATVAVYMMMAFIFSIIISKAVPEKNNKLNLSEDMLSEIVSEEKKEVGNNYLEQIYENNVEISVDSDENVDKIEVENLVQKSENLTIDECIEEAFSLKEQSDAEGAILYYMYALDKKPSKQLFFWIVLDICVIYKSLGQYERAFEILNDYYDVFEDMIDVSVKEEIENNLSDVWNG